MGMDLYIIRKKNIKTPNEISEERFYARKFWPLIEEPKFVKEYNEGYDSFVKARISSVENMEELIEVATHHRDYWGSYKTVPQLCEIRDELEEAMAEGWTYWLEADW